MYRVQGTMTRRKLLRSAGAGVAGLALASTAGEVISGALGAHSPLAPRVPRWHSRPDLRIPALTVTRREEGASEDPIFIAPYNAPQGQAGAVIVDSYGEPLWENPLPGKVTTDFRVQHYRGSPVLTWWEGSIELGHGVGEYAIVDASYRTVRRVQAARGLRGDLHEFVLTRRGTALLTSYNVTRADLSAVGGDRDGTIQDAIFQEIDLASGAVLLEWHSLDHVALQESYSPVGTDWDFCHINSLDLDGDGNVLVSSRSTHTIYKVGRDGTILWRLGGKRSDFAMGARSDFAWQHDARRQPDGTLTVFDNGATPAVERLSRPDPGGRRARDDGEAAAPVHPSAHPRRQPGQRAAAGKRKRVRGLGRSAQRLGVPPHRPDRLRRAARGEVRVLSRVSDALERTPRVGSGDRRDAGAQGPHGLRELEWSNRGALLAAAGRRESGRAAPRRQHALERL